MAPTKGSKRKRDPTPVGTAFKLATSLPPQSIGPTLVSYPAIQPPPSTTFNCYARKKAKNKSSTSNKKDDDDDDNEEREVLVAGETDAVEFVTNQEESRSVAGSGCRYLLAVHNRRTGTVSLLPTFKAPHILSHKVKALKSIAPSAAPTNSQYRDARNALGETFGTKKSQAAIRAQARNKIDVSAMEGVMGYLMEGIEKGAQGLMSTEEAKEAADSSRLIPPFSVTATDPAEVYPLHGIIPEAEWKALSVSAFDEVGDEREQLALLPFRYSDWIKSHLRTISQETKGKKKSFKILFYISAMLAFRQAISRRDANKDQIYEKMGGVPGIVVEGLLSRFTETARESTSCQATTATKTSLLTHIFALCLKLDNYATNTEMIAHDLSMKTAEINQLFRSLGCKSIVLGERERKRLGLPDSAAAKKRAVLSAPVEFPKVRLRKKTTGR